MGHLRALRRWQARASAASVVQRLRAQTAAHHQHAQRGPLRLAKRASGAGTAAMAARTGLLTSPRAPETPPERQTGAQKEASRDNSRLVSPANEFCS